MVVMTEPGTFRVSDGKAESMKDAKSAWAREARLTLIRVAGDFHATIRYSELAEDVQSAAGIRTKMLIHYWIGEVLGAVSHDCRRRHEPLLSALCVNAEGSVGPGYGVLIAELDGQQPPDLDIHAADERLHCYRHFGADLPPDGGKPALTRQLAEHRRRTAQARIAPRGTCPICFLPLTPSGTCGNC